MEQEPSYITLDGTNERVTIGPTPDDNNVPFGIQGDAAGCRTIPWIKSIYISATRWVCQEV